MLSVSEAFNEAESADVNKPKARVYLVLGNYATPAFGGSASATSSAVNYPASGAIDGDRTELNVGAASGADNDVGQSSWRSTTAPVSVHQDLIIDMGQSRTINRVKLYHLSSHAISKFELFTSANGVDYTRQASTPDQPATVQVVTTGEVDTIDFEDVECRYVKLTVNDTAVASDMANVVEFEIYRVVDITSRVISVKTSRARDYQLGNTLAASVSVVCTNGDRFFSPEYSPTSDQDDFFNSELGPGLGLIVKLGYLVEGEEEVVQSFVGSVDRLSIKPGNRTCTIEGRDGMKQLFNRVVSTKLKSSTDIGDLVQFMLNKANISSWESEVDTTGIEPDYFFTFDEAIINTIRSLVQAAGDAQFFMSEDGTATFKCFINSTPLSHTDTTQADFEDGTLTNIDTETESGKFKRKWFLIDDFADGQYTSNPTWTAHNGTWTVSSNKLRCAAVSGVADPAPYNIATPFQQTTGTWQLDMQNVTTAISTTAIFYFMAGSFNVTKRHYQSGYYVMMRSGTAAVLALVKTDAGGNDSVIASDFAYNAGTTSHTVRVTRDSDGEMNVYVDGALKLTATDTSNSSSSNVACAVEGTSNVGGTQWTSGTVDFDNINYSPVVDASGSVSTSQAVLESDTIDQGASINTEGIFQATYVTPSGTSVAFYTATSADDITYDPYVAATPDQQIASTPRRYIKWKAVLTTPNDAAAGNADITTPDVSDVTVAWDIGTGGSPRYPSSVSFFFDEALNIDLEQVYADTVAGGSSIANHVSVKAQPRVLSGADSDVQWQGTVGTPPVDISAGDPLNVTNGQTLTYPIVVQGGMDISRMSGANPPAAAITFAGGGAGSWVFSSIHPTRPVLVITISGSGTITNLQVQGKVFANDDTLLEQTASDTDSIQRYEERRLQVTNENIVNVLIAEEIAERLVENLADPTTYVPQVKVRPTFSVQLGDRVRVTDTNLAIEEDSVVIGVEHQLAANMTGGEAYSTLRLLKIPV